jgi:hypothetical protein
VYPMVVKGCYEGGENVFGKCVVLNNTEEVEEACELLIETHRAQVMIIRRVDVGCEFQPYLTRFSKRFLLEKGLDELDKKIA